MKYYIEKIVHGGFGLSRDNNGQVTLLEEVITGETVTAVVQPAGKGLQKGYPKKILISSPRRTIPSCQYYKHCGGCNFGHMDYETQLGAKEDIIRDLFARNGHQTLRQAGQTSVLKILGAPEPLNYRQRIRLHVDDNHIPGFHKRRSNNCVPVKKCLLAVAEINTCLAEIIPHPALKTLLRRTSSLELHYNPATGRIVLFLDFRQKVRPADKTQASYLQKEIDTLEDIIFTGADFAPDHQTIFSLSIPPLPPHTEESIMLHWQSGGFCQVNLAQNHRLIHTVLDFCGARREDTVLDLFCGMGNFSIPLARKAASVLGIEGQGSSIRMAIKNSDSAGLKNTVFLKQPVHRECNNLTAMGKKFDIVIIDPPRQGAPGLAEQLSALTKQRLVYISCDPATMCRDLADLVDNGFEICRIQPIDMFPQTHHIESVVLLKQRPIS